MPELFIEIGCEEMPAGWLPSLTRQTGTCLTAQLDAARLDWGGPVQTFGTPRRLAVQVAHVSPRQADRTETVIGPPVSAAFDGAGMPTRAALGFARKQGVEVGVLERVSTPRGPYLAHRQSEPGADARTVLPGVLAAALRALKFPKTMHWDARLDDGHGAFMFGRPIRWIVFLHGGSVVPFVIARTVAANGVRSVAAGAVTFGHRFFSREGAPGRPIRVRSFADYRRRLAREFVLIDRGERRRRIDTKLKARAARLGGTVAAVEGESTLLDEVPDLVEYPAVVTGAFPREFLRLPAEVLVTTMIHHQHYFPVLDRRGDLMPNFLAVTNTPRDNVPRIARNAERVLVARLRDAQFFWDADRKRPLEDRLARLETLQFHKRLGSYRAKTERVAALAARIARDAFDRPDAAAAAERAALLAKTDLTTEMVGELPELQGVMGGVYAREQGEPETVWKAVYHHYLPTAIGAADPPSREDLGAAAVPWAAVALADKLDTVVGLFAVGERPTGSRDPLGIRRQAQGLLRILVDLSELTGLEARVSVERLRRWAQDGYDDRQGEGVDAGAVERTRAFLLERLRYLFEDRGLDRRTVRAVTHQSLDALRPLDVRRKLEVLPQFADTADFRTLALLFKRVKNIARTAVDGAAVDGPFEALLTEPAERALLEVLRARRAVIDAAVKTGAGFREAFAEAAEIGPAVDRFFAEVFVMVDDMALRHARLCLIRQVEEVILQLADVSEIVQEP